MYRIVEAEERELGILLEKFRWRYPAMRVSSEVLDITHCFDASQTPNYLREGVQRPVVKAFTIENGPSPRKWNHEEATFSNDKRKPAEYIPHKYFELEASILELLCTVPLKNIALSEIVNFNDMNWNPAMISRRVISRMEKCFREAHGGDFNPYTDNAFIFFRNTSERAERAARLNALWLEQMKKEGERFLEKPPTDFERDLLRKVFPQELLEHPSEENIKRNSYGYEKENYNPQSTWFLAKMLERHARAGGV